MTDCPVVPPEKSRRISRKVRTAIDPMVSGEYTKIVHAAQKACLSREHLSRELSRPHIAEHMRQKILRSLNVASPRAGAVKVDLLDSPTELVRDRASSFVLGLAGIQPATELTVDLSTEVKVSNVIDLSDDPPPAMRTIPHV
jgi:hypothetical protein